MSQSAWILTVSHARRMVRCLDKKSIQHQVHQKESQKKIYFDSRKDGYMLFQE